MGANEGVWGSELNASTFDMFDEAIAGVVSVSLTAGNVTLSANNGTADEARNPLIILTGSPGVTRTVTFPDVEGLHWIINNSDSTATLTAGAGTTVSLLTGERIKIYTDGATNLATLWGPYKESTFTPAIAFGGASVGVTYTTQVGQYTRIGNRVFFEIAIVLSNKGSSVGSATVTGLPVAAGGSVNAMVNARFSSVNLDTAGGRYSPGCFISASTIALYEQGDNVADAALTDADFGNTSEVWLAGFYRV